MLGTGKCLAISAGCVSTIFNDAHYGAHFENNATAPISDAVFYSEHPAGRQRYHEETGRRIQRSGAFYLATRCYGTTHQMY